MVSFFTPWYIAQFMTRLITARTGNIRILDAGAGVGIAISSTCTGNGAMGSKTIGLSLTAYEIDPNTNRVPVQNNLVLLAVV